MWGNSLGWGISGVITLLVVAIGTWLQSALGISPPTDFSQNPANLAPLSLPVGLSIPATQPGDGGDLYLKAAGEYIEQQGAINTFIQDPSGDPPESIQLVLAAVGKSSATLFIRDPSQIVNYDAAHPHLDNLQELGNAVAQAGEALRLAKKPDDARRYFIASYVLGTTMVRERLVFDEYTKGVGLMDESLAGLGECEPAGSARIAEYDNLSHALVDFDTKNVRPIYGTISSANADVIETAAGDIFVFATQSQERMFRVEAILKLGRYRFDAFRAGDQHGATRYLQVMTGDPDPVIQTAARAGANLTIEQYRTIH
jgi:hypothetical protein